MRWKIFKSPLWCHKIQCVRFGNAPIRIWAFISSITALNKAHRMIYGLIFYDTITVSFGDRASCCLATPQCRNWRSFYTVRKWQSDDNKSTLCNFQYFWTSSWLFSLWRKDIVFDGLKIAVDEKVTQQVIAIIHAGCASVPLAFFRMEYTNMYNWRRNQRNAINRRKKYGEIYDVHLRFEFFFFVGSSKYIAEGIFRLLIGGSLFVFFWDWYRNSKPQWVSLKEWNVCSCFIENNVDMLWMRDAGCGCGHKYLSCDVCSV